MLEIIDETQEKRAALANSTPDAPTSSAVPPERDAVSGRPAFGPDLEDAIGEMEQAGCVPGHRLRRAIVAHTDAAVAEALARLASPSGDAAALAREVERLRGQLAEATEAVERHAAVAAAFEADAFAAIDGAMLAEALVEATEREVEDLRLALHDAITRPMGVVPDSARRWYSPAVADRATRTAGGSDGRS